MIEQYNCWHIVKQNSYIFIGCDRRISRVKYVSNSLKPIGVRRWVFDTGGGIFNHIATKRYFITNWFNIVSKLCELTLVWKEGVLSLLNND